MSLLDLIGKQSLAKEPNTAGLGRFDIRIPQQTWKEILHSKTKSAGLTLSSRRILFLITQVFHPPLRTVGVSYGIGAGTKLKVYGFLATCNLFKGLIVEF